MNGSRHGGSDTQYHSSYSPTRFFKVFQGGLDDMDSTWLPIAHEARHVGVKSGKTINYM
jgi:hypothetical protein